MLSAVRKEQTIEFAILKIVKMYKRYLRTFFFENRLLL